MSDEAPSPFLPGTKIQFAFDSTSLGLLKTCPRLYQYTMLEGWAAKSDNIHLRFGAEFHSALWNYDNMVATGMDHEEAVRETVHALCITSADFDPKPALTPDGDLYNPRDPARYKNRESLWRTVIYYLDHRRNDTLKTYIMADGTPAVELSFRFELDWGPDAANVPTWNYKDGDFPTDGSYKLPGSSHPRPYLLCGHLDRVCVDPQSNLYIEDHKTTTSTPGPYFFDQYSPSNQMSLYTTAGQIVLNAPVHGVAINAVQLLLEHPWAHFSRGFTFRTPAQLAEWQTDLSRYLQLAEWYAENDYWPQNDTACGLYGGCKFRKICSKSPSVREVYLRSDFVQLPPEQRWNPLSVR